MRTNQQWATRMFIWQGVAQGCELIPYLPFAPSKAGDFQPEGHPTGISTSFPGRLIHRKQLSGSGHQADCPALAVPTHVHNIQANERVQDISGQFSPNASSSARSCYKERGEEMAVGPLAGEVLDVAKDFFLSYFLPRLFWWDLIRSLLLSVQMYSSQAPFQISPGLLVSELSKESHYPGNRCLGLLGFFWRKAAQRMVLW